MRKYYATMVMMMLVLPSGIQDTPEEVLELKVLNLKLQKSKIDAGIDLIELTMDSVENIKDLPRLLANQNSKKEAEKFLDEFIATSKAFSAFLPKSYGEEIVPFMVGRLKNQPLPLKPTELEEKLIKAQKAGKFEGVVQEVAALLNEERVDLLNQRMAVAGQIEIAKGDLERIRAQKKKK